MRVAPEFEALVDAYGGEGCDPGWSTEEFDGVEFQDARLQKRFLVVSAQLAAQPQASINQACEDWAATKAAYRLFENPKVEPARILAPHQQRTCARMLGQTRIFALQDTCYLNYTSHPATQGLGLIGADQDGQVGLLMHSTLAMTAEGVPLGLLTQTIWARPEADVDADAAARRVQRRQRPVAAKESGKWLKAVRETQALGPAGVEVVHLCDREADFYELFQEVSDLGAQMVVRASQDRAVLEGGQIRQVLSQRPVSGYLTVAIPAQQGRAARTATVEVRYGEVTLRPPYRPPACQVSFRPLQVWGVWVREVDPPPAVEAPLEWLLLTNVPVASFLDAVERVRWYRLRWHIEVFHRVLKCGCQVEACRLDQAEELTRYLTLKSVIAWRLYWMVQIARVQPEAACTLVLAAHEWQALYAAIHRTSDLPETLPTVRQVMRWIAQLGGFLGRTRDGEPGVTVIWRGWQRLHDLATMWLVLHGTPDGE
jgi:hypothetical protein